MEEDSEKRSGDDDDKNRRKSCGKKQELTREWCPQRRSARAERVEVQASAVLQAENTSEEKERESLYVCQSLWIPVSASLLVNFAPVGYLCGGEKSADFVYQAGWRPSALCCCALVILGACLREPDNKIWAPLGQIWQKLTSPLTWSQWGDPQSRLSEE